MLVIARFSRYYPVCGKKNGCDKRNTELNQNNVKPSNGETSRDKGDNRSVCLPATAMLAAGTVSVADSCAHPLTLELIISLSSLLL